MRKLCPKSAFLAAFGLLLLTAGCSTAPQPAAAARSAMAHFIAVNLGNCEWRIVISPVAGGEARSLQLTAWASQAIDLPGGDYLIEQAVLAADAGNGSVRRFPTRLDAGQTYRWRLATLLTAPPARTGGDPAADKHERER
jgi:hypothetical protein